MNDEQRLAELAQFLRSRRERIRPADAGIVVGPRRRAPGLRREEVAQLAGVSVAWYTFLEQGRPVRASEAVLDWLAQVLQLNPAERIHLYLLARGHAPSERRPISAAVSSALQALLDAVPYPAFAVSADWTVVAWNKAALLVIADFEHLSGRDRNLVWRMFTDASQRRRLVNWEDQAKSLLSLFRASTAHNVGEEWYDRLVADLSGQSPEFRDWWRRHDVRASHAGPKEFRHPVVGRMLFEPVTLRQEGVPPLWVMFKVPAKEANTPLKLAKLLAQSTASDSARKRSAHRKAAKPPH